MKRTVSDEELIYIVEAFYSEDGGILGWTEKEAVWGETLEEIRQCLAWMLEALEKPLLDEAELVQRAEEIEAMGADLQEVGIEELGTMYEEPVEG